MNTRFFSKVLLVLVIGGAIFATGCSRYHSDKGPCPDCAMKKSAAAADKAPAVRPMPPGPGRPGMRGMGQEGAMGMRGPGGQGMRGDGFAVQRLLNPRAKEELGLSDAQAEQIRQIAERAREQSREPAERRRDGEEKLRAMMEARNPDTQAIMEQIDQQSRDMAAVRKAQVGAMLEARKVLTPEQFEKARQMRPRQDGMGPGRMGRGPQMGAGAGQGRPERPLAQQRRERIHQQPGNAAR